MDGGLGGKGNAHGLPQGVSRRREIKEGKLWPGLNMGSGLKGVGTILGNENAKACRKQFRRRKNLTLGNHQKQPSHWLVAMFQIQEQGETIMVLVVKNLKFRTQDHRGER